MPVMVKNYVLYPRISFVKVQNRGYIRPWSRCSKVDQVQFQNVYQCPTFRLAEICTFMLWGNVTIWGVDGYSSQENFELGGLQMSILVEHFIQNAW